MVRDVEIVSTKERNPFLPKESVTSFKPHLTNLQYCGAINFAAPNRNQNNNSALQQSPAQIVVELLLTECGWSIVHRDLPTTRFPATGSHAPGSIVCVSCVVLCTIGVRKFELFTASWSVCFACCNKGCPWHFRLTNDCLYLRTWSEINMFQKWIPQGRNFSCQSIIAIKHFETLRGHCVWYYQKENIMNRACFDSLWPECK